MRISNIIYLSIIILVLSACNTEKIVPKPRGFFRIGFEKKEYISLNPNYPFHFEYPLYSYIVDEDGPFAEPYWINIVFVKHNAQIHISYKQVNGMLEELVNDSHELAYKHALKAVSINEKIFDNPGNNVYGTLFDISGNAASPIQFHLTDSVKHFIRGSFYISETPNFDSLKPVIQFIEADIIHMIETLTWN